LHLHLAARHCSLTAAGLPFAGRPLDTYNQMPAETAIGIPDRFAIDDNGAVFRIRWKWPRIAAVALGLFSVAWDTFLVAWYKGALTQTTFSPVMLIFPIGHVAIGVVLPYVALAFLMNHTLIEIEAGVLRVRHRPIPFPGSRTVTVGDVQQVFCVEREGRKGPVTYDVMIRLTSERETKLVSGLDNERDARFIEQRIEQRLGITDRGVYGEIAREASAR
jgi:hypothetical protein